jgi:alkanesulfonate monooxygenase SsuD/methylene tetrahydromethanopterin reductase-like flavin-dependent oxidoreductase (luciferase family)
MKLHGWADEAAELHRLSVGGKWDEMVSVVTDEMIEEFCVVGTWDVIAGKMKEKYAGINSQVSFPGDPKTPEEFEQVTEIIAELKTIPTVADA